MPEHKSIVLLKTLTTVANFRYEIAHENSRSLCIPYFEQPEARLQEGYS